MSASLNHEENLAFLREGKGGLTLGADYYGTEEQYRQAHGLDIPGEGSNLHPEADASAETDKSSAESEPSHETTIPLLPGVAVFSLNGPYNDGDGEPNAQWSLPGDFLRYLQPGEPNTEASGLVREILVGSYRNPTDDDNDDPAYLGTFIPDSEWDVVVGSLHRENLRLIAEIGLEPGGDRPDYTHPQGGSWLAERSERETEAADLKRRIEELEANLAAPAAPSALPPDALELIQQTSGLSKAKAEAVLAALQASTTETAPQ